MSTSIFHGISPVIRNTSSASGALPLPANPELQTTAVPSLNDLEFVVLDFPHPAFSLIVSNEDGKT
ncbi:MAG: hypothetical protein HN867_18845 [Deltaproteobacteria bacterium]|nr:hypothetical protein [Deltaproteobacteria bacterium]